VISGADSMENGDMYPQLLQMAGHGGHLDYKYSKQETDQITGWAQKTKPLSFTGHHLIVLKPTVMARFFINFDYKMGTRI